MNEKEIDKKISEEIKKEALAHYDRMISWVEKQDLKEKTNYFKMECEIQESWFSDDCQYCSYYMIEDELIKGEKDDYEECDICPLKENYSCCNELWEKMHESSNWGEWLIYAKEVREFIRKNG